MAKQPGISTSRQGQIIRVVFQILIDNPEGLPGRQLMYELQMRVPFTDYERGHYASNPTENRGVIATRFWTVNCVNDGWMAKSKTAWTLTDAGRIAYDTITDPGEFARESSREYEAWKREQTESVEDAADDLGTDASGTDDVTETMSVEIAEEAASAHVQTHLATMDPYAFQDLVAALLRAMGYHVRWVSPPRPDRGIDIDADTDPLGATDQGAGEATKRQVERRRCPIVHRRARIARCRTVQFGWRVHQRRQARGTQQENRRVTLINLEQFFDLWVEHSDAITDSAKELLPLKPVYFLAPKE